MNRFTHWLGWMVFSILTVAFAHAEGLEKVFVRGTIASGGTAEILLGTGSVSSGVGGLIDGHTSLFPDKKYQLTFNASGMGPTGTLTLIAPAGYQFFINGAQRSRLSISNPSGEATVTEVHDVEMRSGSSGGTAGTDSKVTVDDISWGVNVGRLYNGTLAGSIVIREAALNTALFNREVLNYSGINQQVVTLNDSQGLRQVIAPEVFVDIHDITNGFTLDFYPLSAMGPLQNGLRQIANPGEKYVSYTLTPGSTAGTLNVVRTAGNVSQTTQVQQTGGTWLTTLESQLIKEERTSTVVNGNRVETVVLKNGANQVARKIKRTYHAFAWNLDADYPEPDQLIEVVTDPDGAALTTSYEYYTDAAQIGSYKQLKSIVQPNGNWVKYEYYEDNDNRRGQVKRRYMPWKNAPSLPADATVANCRVVEYDYVADWDGVGRLMSSQITKVDGTTVAKETAAFTVNNTVNGLKLWTQETRTYTNATEYLTVVSKRYQPAQDEANALFNSLPYSQTGPDETKTSYLYQRGDYNEATGVFTTNASGSAFRATSFQGTAKTSVGTSFASYDGVTIDSINLVPNRSTKTVKIMQNGRLMREEVHVYTGSTNFSSVAWTKLEYTASGRLKRREASTGAVYSAFWENEFRTSETTETGEQIAYSPDAIQRIHSVTKSGAPAFTNGTITYPAQNSRTTVFNYNAAGDVLATTTSGGDKIVTTSASFDKSGRKLSYTDETGASIGYAHATGGREVTATLASGSTTISTTFRDGQLNTVTGTGQVPQHYDYSFNADGTLTATSHAGTATSGAWSSSKYDWAGRVVEQKSPTTVTGIDAVQNYFYYPASGKLRKTTSPGRNASIYVYDDLGALEYSGLDVDGNDALTQASLDRISKQEGNFIEENGGWWWQQKSFVFPKDNVATAVRTSTTKTRMSGFAAGVFSEQKTIDAFGNETVSHVEIDSQNRLAYSVLNAPDTASDAESVTYNGFLVESLSALGERVTFTYDGLGRPSTSVHPRKGTLVTSYDTTRNLVTQKHYADGPILAKYTYDSSSRVVRTENGAGHFSAQAYDSFGRPWRTWGSAAYPLEYVYDTLGRLEKQITYRSGSDWGNETRPDSTFGTASIRDTTVFAYYGDTNALQKRTDAADKAVTFVYDAAGRVETQTQSRLNGVSALIITTAFSSSTGELTSVSYSDNTPTLGYSYTRLGQVKTVTDVTGTRTFLYDDDTGLQLTDELLPTYFGSDRRLHYTYEASQAGALGRTKGMSFGTSAAPGSIQAVDYAFSAYGQLASITAGPAGGTRGFTYGYVANQPGLVKSVTQAATGYTVDREYDPQFDMVKVITTQLNTTIIAKHEYTFNDLGQRMSAKQSGTAFADYGDSTFYRYGYNSRGELTTAAQYLGDNVDVQTQPLPGRRFEYNYDAIGNRTAGNHTGTAGLTEDYTANALNQITSKENHVVHFSGTGLSGMTMKAQAPYVSQSGSQGRFWSTEVGLNNVSTPAKASIRLDFGKAGAGGGGLDLVATDTRSIFLPPAVESFEYDHDGNLTKDGQWDYSYDAKNQLTRVETRSDVIGLLQGVTGGAQPRVLEFSYDYQGRRVGRKAYSRSGTQWVLESEKRYVYQGWNVIAELDADTNKSVVRQFFWGLDITSTLGGGGGVGGLLMIQEGNQSYFPAYDGNGNVTALTRASDSSIVASYEYSPFGELLRAQGSYAASNPFRFSTKWHDDETGLVYYGKRYYCPRLGRFINRDPIGEAGGLNLYGFTRNGPVNGWDLLGNNTMSPALVNYYLLGANLFVDSSSLPLHYLGQSGVFSLYQDTESGEYWYEDASDGREGGFSSAEIFGDDPYQVMKEKTAWVDDLVGWSDQVAETAAEARREDAAKAAAVQQGLAWITNGTLTNIANNLATGNVGAINGILARGGSSSLNGGDFAGLPGGASNSAPICFVAGTFIATGDGKFQPIEDIEVGQRVQTADNAAAQQSDTDVDPVSWRKVDFLIPNADGKGNDFKLTTLMPLSRIEDEGLEVGETKQVDFEEMGIHGQAQVLAISECPPIEEGSGRVVLSTFTRLGRDLYELRVAGVEELIKVTGTHPLFSHDRQTWVAVAELKAGESVWTASGPARVESLRKSAGSERVYNFEVEKDHRYYVTKSRVLAHNQCTAPNSAGNTGSQLPQNVSARGYSVLLVSEAAQLPGGSIATKMGINHQWIAVYKNGALLGAAGLGNRAGIPGENGQRSPDSPVVSNGFVVDHASRMNGSSITTQRVFMVDPTAVLTYVSPSNIGRNEGPWILGTNDCNTWCREVISNSTPRLVEFPQISNPGSNPPPLYRDMVITADGVMRPPVTTTFPGRE